MVEDIICFFDSGSVGYLYTVISLLLFYVFFRLQQDRSIRKHKEKYEDYKRLTIAKKRNLAMAELKSPKAIELLGIAVKAGILNDDYSKADNTTVAQLALLAEIISDILGLKNKWSPFEALWGIKNIAQTRSNTKSRIGKVRGGEAIEELYKSYF